MEIVRRTHHNQPQATYTQYHVHTHGAELAIITWLENAITKYIPVADSLPIGNNNSMGHMHHFIEPLSDHEPIQMTEYSNRNCQSVVS